MAFLKTLSLFVLFYSSFAIAANKALINVLEAPLFKEPNENSKVVQYVLKGNEIYLHPQETAQNRFEELIKDEDVDDNEKSYNAKFSDPLFDNSTSYRPDPQSRFYKTLDKRGNDAYVLKRHVYVLYHDKRELTEKSFLKNDDTDYRLSEPLPKNYPLKEQTGFKSNTSLNLGFSNRSSYPYQDPIKDQGKDLYTGFSFSWLRKVDWEENNRFFFGGIFQLNTEGSTFIFDQYNTKEDALSLGIGPVLSYEAWRNEKYKINLSTALLFNFYNSLTISFSPKEALQSLGITSDNMSFSAQNFTPRFNASVELLNFVLDFDLYTAFNLDFRLPYRYRITKQPDTPNSANYITKDFNSEFTAQLSFAVGLQRSF